MEHPTYGPLRHNIEHFLAGEATHHQLRHHCLQRFVPEPGLAEGLWKMTMMHLASFSTGDWSEDELRMSLSQEPESFATQGIACVTDMMKDQRWFDIVQSGQIPWPIERVK